MRLIHVWGIVGAGKTVCINDVLSQQGHMFFKFNCQNPFDFDMDKILNIIAKNNLSEKDYHKWYQIWKKRCSNEIYSKIYHQEQYHTITNFWHDLRRIS